MIIFNNTRKILISAKVVEANTLVEKLVGLIGSKKPRAIVLRTRFGIHTFGLRFPIDCLILDREGRVVDMREQLLPGRIFFWSLRYSTIVELPVGTIRKSKTKIGDEIQFERSTN